jgi:NitT/TauT family transport system substrate-binding protein
MLTPSREKALWCCWSVIFILGMVLGLMSSPSFAASDAGARPEKTEIVVAYPQPSGVFTPLYVSYEAGLFKKHGLEIRLQVLNPQSTLQAVISGSADLAASGDMVNARLQGARVKFFAGGVQQYVFQMWGAKDITDIQQLKGKTMAVSVPGAATDSSAREVLKRNGLSADKDVKFIYLQTIPAILSAVVTGNAAAGVLSAPNTLKAREAGLNLLADIGKFNIFGLQSAYWATEQYLKDNPNVIYAFLKAVAEGTILSRRDPAGAQRAIAKHVKLDDPKMVNETYSVFEPYMVLSLALRPEAIQAQLAYLDEKQFPQARNADVKEFFDNSFVENLERSGFFQKIGLSK